MNIRRLARRNLTGNAQQYAAYFLSCVFAVSIFFIYAQFILHPDVMSRDIRGGDTVRSGMISAQVIIVIFSVFFIAYSNSTFLQTRSQEFGLLSLFGMSKRQLRKLIYLEQTITSLLAIIIGLGLGTLFSKLFLMLMSAMLDTEAPIAFEFVPMAYVITVVGFIVLFQALTLLSFWKMRGQTVQDFLQDARKPKVMPRSSMTITVIALLFLGFGYFIAATASLELSFLLIFPILFFVLIGSYFLFTQGTVAAYKRLYKRNSLLQGTRLVTRTNILFRLKDYARMLFLTSTITAVVLTAAGTVYLANEYIVDLVTDQTPASVAWLEESAAENAILEPERAEEIIAEYDTEIEYSFDVEMLPADVSISGDEGVVAVFPETNYNNIASHRDLDPLALEEDEIFITSPMLGFGPWTDIEDVNQLGMDMNGEQTTMDIAGTAEDAIVGATNQGQIQVVMNDVSYLHYASQYADDEKLRSLGYHFVDWENEVEVSNALEEEAEDSTYSFQTMAPPFQALQQGFSLTLFIGLFVSLLFFIVQGSMLYLKLFTELEDTKKQLLSLNRIGITRKEAGKILGHKIKFLFFVPLAVGALHASFAYAMLASILDVNLFWSAVMVISIYAILQYLYYLITRHFYLKAAFR
ncbi:ABC transporter permease [Natribacillus halophilus]|uniref:Putative ABC transport system permease protein n=1 Tax=Natribacillus halophilus TaxID=549003 RepID=A0A1G8S1T4_9BACI|nr:ABC transporter permease [Natribacillus halophilus]SDJ23153.1 putative ABC transport system permease protein [Natribacillus halophilus]